ncbi:hypothetical protein ACWC9R_12015 [Streptomyces sp. NPDC001219]
MIWQSIADSAPQQYDVMSGRRHGTRVAGSSFRGIYEQDQQAAEEAQATIGFDVPTP